MTIHPDTSISVPITKTEPVELYESVSLLSIVIVGLFLCIVFVAIFTLGGRKRN